MGKNLVGNQQEIHQGQRQQKHMKGREKEITREPTTKEPTTAKHGLRSNRPTEPTVHILHPGTKSQ